MKRDNPSAPCLMSKNSPPLPPPPPSLPDPPPSFPEQPPLHFIANKHHKRIPRHGPVLPLDVFLDERVKCHLIRHGKRYFRRRLECLQRALLCCYSVHTHIVSYRCMCIPLMSLSLERAVSLSLDSGLGPRVGLISQAQRHTLFLSEFHSRARSH